MYTNTNTIKLFDSNNNLLPDFDERIEDVLKSIHGDNYYDTDEELVNTNIIQTVVPKEVEKEVIKTEIQDDVKEEIYHDEELDKTIEYVDGLVPESEAYNIKLVGKKEKHKITIKDFVPVIFFILIFAVIIVAGYYFLNNFDLTSLIGGKAE